MAPLPWVKGLITGEMTNGRIDAKVISRTLGGPERPSNFEDSGADRTVYDTLRQRSVNPFKFQTNGFMGGAIAWILDPFRLKLLPESLLPRLEKFNLLPFAKRMYIALIRNAGAPTIQFCAEPAGGMQENPNIDWLFDQLDEGLELGIYNNDGWLGFILPEEFSCYQEMLDQKQTEWWQIVDPNLARCGYAKIKFLAIGQDTQDGIPGIICPCLTAGEWSFLKVATIELEGEGWMLRDLECRRTPTGWAPLNRAVAGILPRNGLSPMFYRFSREGGLDECGPHFPLSGEVIDYVLSHLSVPLLGPYGLNWL